MTYCSEPRLRPAPTSRARWGGAALALALLAGGEVLAQAQPPEAAVVAATEGYSQMERGDFNAAITAARQAVNAAPDWLDYRLLLTDAFLRAGRNVEAYAALAPAASQQDYRVQSRLAQAANGAGLKSEAAIAFGAAAELAPEGESRAYLTRARIMTLLELNDQAGARQAFDRAWAAGVLSGHAPIDAAMLAIAVGDDAAAQSAFAEAERSQRLTGRVALDAGYSARRVGRNADAVRYFTRGLADARAGQFDLPAQQDAEIRQEITALGGSGL